MKQVVIGMAGHIDHGKTSIIKSLTGTKTERYSEEVERGLTIDIGFAFLNNNISLIDVPGHEKFIKNMLTGSCAIDFAILVIASDDGIMPQTIEHFDILKLLKIKQGLIVLNKIDLVDKDWIELLIEDIQEMTKGSFLENCKIVKTSTTQNIGIQALKNEILSHSENISNKYDRGFFRMAIDRAFTIKGYGSVVTGTVTSGQISIGDTIDVLPNRKQYKIRGLHSQGELVEEVTMGARAAINIGNLDINNIARGHQVSSLGYLSIFKKIIVRFTSLKKIKKPLKQNERIRIHIGTNESIGRISLVNLDQLDPGESCILLIKLESKIIATMGDKFILRTFSPLMTIGGGEVIDGIIDEKWKKIKDYIISLENLQGSDIKKHMIESQKFKPLLYQEGKIKFGLGNKQIEEFINLNNEIFYIEYKSKKWLVTVKQLDNCRLKLLKILSSNKDIYDIGFSKSLILQKINGDDRFLDFLLKDLEDSKRIYKKNEKWIIKGEEIVLNRADGFLKDNLLEILNKQGFETPNLEELSIRNNCNKERTKKILSILEKNNEVVRINETLIFSMKNLSILKEDLNKFFLLNEILLMKDFKEITGTTRKYAVPLLEYFDKIKFTFRVDEGRKLIR